MRELSVRAAVSAAVTALTLVALGWAPQVHAPGPVKLENARIRVSQIDYAPGTPHPHYIRPTDPVIVFQDDCRYERVDSSSGAREIRERKSGDVIWQQG
jgi:hypothetical protein